VAYDYRISKYEVTNAQYAEFLNAVADTDTNGLYNAEMDSDTNGGITQSGSSGSFSYSVKTGFTDKPVNFVSFWDALRFANWLHNGQQVGAQDNTTTEDGAYAITEAGIADDSITRNAGATIFLTSEDEWYKAAYYDALSMSYFDYPAGSNTVTTCAAPTGAPNSANCLSGYAATDVGSYTGSPSPYGTFDQGGNVWEFNEGDGFRRFIRGGSSASSPGELFKFSRYNIGPSYERSSDLGFRVASLPEPAAGLLVLTGLLGLAAQRSRSGCCEARRG
jgi:formylglycine-generating enzyme required for sulfatase activity